MNSNEPEDQKPEDPEKLILDNVDDTSAKYVEAYHRVSQILEEKQNQIIDDIKGLIKICDEEGIAYDFTVCLLGNKYTPQSFFEKWKRENAEEFREFLSDLNLATPDEYSGWERSQIC